jgi:hypothetical protein
MGLVGIEMGIPHAGTGAEQLGVAALPGGWLVSSVQGQLQRTRTLDCQPVRKAGSPVIEMPAGGSERFHRYR